MFQTTSNNKKDLEMFHETNKYLFYMVLPSKIASQSKIKTMCQHPSLFPQEKKGTNLRETFLANSFDTLQGRERLDQWHDGGISMCTRLCWSTVWVPQNWLVIFEDAWKVTWYKKKHQILLVVLSNIRWTCFPMLYKDMVFHDPVSIYGPIFCCKLFHDMAPDWEPTHGGEGRN